MLQKVSMLRSAMANFALVILCLCAILGPSSAIFTPILNTRNLGRLVGVQEFSEDGTPFYSFKGIRYGEPPVGEFRFKEPREAAPVPKNVLVNATTFGPSCTQLFRDPATLRGCEDCLRLNIYTPSTSQDKLYPVVMYIHGGGFNYGNATGSGIRLVARGIVVVTLHYRVGILGFLSSGDKDLPGNYGLLDQQLALKWIQKNIHEFCGDPKRVTVSGSSAGAASTTLHLVSPGSRELIQGAIATSGTFLSPWVLHFGDREKVRAVARLVGCPCSANTPISALMPCLRSVDANKLTEAQLHFQPWHELPFAPFGPVIDHNFLPEDPYKLLLEGKVARVPVLMSCATAEGLYTVAEIMQNKTALAELDRHWNELAPLLLDYVDTARTKRDRDLTSIAIRNKYLGRSPINNSTVPQLIRIDGDRHFVAGIDQFAKTLASVKGSRPVYMYENNYRGEFSVSQGWSNSSVNRGPSHSDDINLILPGYYPTPPVRTPADRNMTRSFVDIWESFIKTGIPTTANFPVWHPVPKTGDRITILKLASYNTGALITVPELGCSSFWRSLPLVETGFTNSYPILDLHSVQPQLRRVPAFVPQQYDRHFAAPVRFCQPLNRSGWRYL